MNKDKLISICINACRFFLAAVFAFSGFIKANDPLGTVYKIQDYLEAWELYAFKDNFFPYVMSVSLGVFEFVVGINFLLGLRKKLTAFLILVFMLVMTPLSLWLAIENPISDCGCFGDAVLLTNWETFAKNVVLLVAAILVARYSNRIIKLVSDRVDWLMSLYAFVFIIFFALYSYHRLPTFDFRPFKIGTDIRAAMEVPEGAQKTVYETVLLYAKDGETRRFTIDNYPKNTTWVFVDAETVVKEKGYEPPISDFTIISCKEGDDITPQVLSDSGYTFLLVAPWLSKADDSEMDLINEVYDYSRDHGYRFIALTASNDEDIELWSDNTGAEYEFAIMDEILLKTIVRSSPGLVLIKDGVIINKWSCSNLPDEYTLSAPLDKLPIGDLNKKTVAYKIFSLLAWFILPLLFLMVIDVIWRKIQTVRTKKVK